MDRKIPTFGYAEQDARALKEYVMAKRRKEKKESRGLRVEPHYLTGSFRVSIIEDDARGNEVIRMACEYSTPKFKGVR